ncbi:MAG: hypothetical protein GY854_01980 [Deltaproteobacteria bacterium]|nr:hypothetical protein [Deltaproteobacteria bacterium]
MKRMVKIITMVVLTAVIGLAFIPGCDSEDEKTYDINISWEILGFSQCVTTLPEKFGGGQMAFTKMKIYVYENEGDEETVQNPFETPCSDKQTTIYNLERGQYFVVVEAIANHQEQVLPYFEGTATIDVPAENEDKVHPIPLNQNTGSIEVGWGFDNYRQCNDSSVMVSEVKIILVGKDNKYETDPPIPCSEANYLFEDLKWDLYTLTIVGFNEEGEPTHRGTWGSTDADGDSDGDADTDASDAGADSGADTDTDIDTDIDTDGPTLDIRPGSFITSDEAFVVLSKTSE